MNVTEPSDDHEIVGLVILVTALKPLKLSPLTVSLSQHDSVLNATVFTVMPTCAVMVQRWLLP